METYTVVFQNGNKIHKVTVQATGIVPAIDEAVRKHFKKYMMDAFSYEIVKAEKVTE